MEENENPQTADSPLRAGDSSPNQEVLGTGGQESEAPTTATQTEPVVADPQPTVESPLTDEPMEKKSFAFLEHKAFIAILLVLVLITIGVIVYLYFQNQNLKKEMSQPVPTPTPTTFPNAPTPAPDPTTNQVPNGDLADWGTYTNTKYKYTLNYPNNYAIYLEEPIMFPEGTTINNATTIAIREKNSNPNSEHMTIDVFSFKDISPEELANEIYSISLNNQNTFIESIEGVNNTTFVDLPAYQLTLKSKGYNNSHIGSLGPEGIVQHIVFERSDTTWVISLYKNKLFDQILSTFEFLDEEDVNTQLGNPFQLKIGQTANVISEELRVKFIKITEDSRCPTEATCVWEGQVRVSVAMSKVGDGSTYVGLTNRSGRDELSLGAFGEYEIKLIKVDPYPVSTSTETSQYLASFIISKKKI